jgi:hypothetical protein
MFGDIGILPTELLIRIFLLVTHRDLDDNDYPWIDWFHDASLSSLESNLHNAKAAITLSHVSRRWNDIAKNVPILWAALYVLSEPTDWDFAIVDRAGNAGAPLAIAVFCSHRSRVHPDWHPEWVDQLQKRIPKAAYLQLGVDNGYLSYLLQHAPKLRSLQIRSTSKLTLRSERPLFTPLLSTLHLIDIYPTFPRQLLAHVRNLKLEYKGFSPADMVAVISVFDAAPMLEELIIDTGTRDEAQWDDLDIDPLLLHPDHRRTLPPNLARATFFGDPLLNLAFLNHLPFAESTKRMEFIEDDSISPSLRPTYPLFLKEITARTRRPRKLDIRQPWTWARNELYSFSFNLHSHEWDNVMTLSKESENREECLNTFVSMISKLEWKHVRDLRVDLSDATIVDDMVNAIVEATLFQKITHLTIGSNSFLPMLTALTKKGEDTYFGFPYLTDLTIVGETMRTTNEQGPEWHVDDVEKPAGAFELLRLMMVLDLRSATNMKVHNLIFVGCTFVENCEAESRSVLERWVDTVRIEN